VTRYRIAVAAFLFMSWPLPFDVIAAEHAATASERTQNSNVALIEKGNWPDTLAATRENYQATNAVMAASGWYLCNEKFDSRSIHEAYPPETLHVAFDASRSIDGWKIVPRTEDGRFARYLSPGQTTYIYREFICTRDDAHLESTFAVNAGHLAVWHNGVRVFAEESENTREPLQKTVALRFRKGKNFLLVKMAAARGANFKFSTNRTSMNQLKKELSKHYGHGAFLLCKSGYFKEHQRWLFERDTGDLLKQAATALLSSLRGFSELERDLAVLTDKSPDAHPAEWIGFYTTVASLRRDFDLARSQWEMTADTEALRRALLDLDKTFPGEYPGARYLEQLAAFESELPEIRDGVMRREKAALDRYQAYLAFRRAALLANPLIDFEELLFVRRVEGIYTGLPNNYIGNTGITYDLDDTIATTRIRDTSPAFNTVYKPSRNVFCGDIDLHFDAEKIVFSSLDAHGQWQVYELPLRGSEPRQVTHEPDDVDCYDPMYLPDERILFNCTSGYHGVPCIGGKDDVANLHVMEKDGSNVRRLCYDQDHDWYPSLLPNGRVLYLRWEYTDTPHYFSRVLMHMRPDGTDQVEFYGSNSYWPNGLWYARALPGSNSRFVAIVSGHHGSTRMGELAVFDVGKGRFETSGVIQRIPGYGKPVEPVIVDGLSNGSWPKFIHPYPLSDKYFLVSARLTGGTSPVGIYLVDVFDNILLLKEVPGQMLLEPIPLRKSDRPPVIPDRVQKDSTEATVYIQDIYTGKGLRDVPRSTVSSLRVFQYEYGYRDYAGGNSIACDGAWDVRRIIGTVPVYEDGSASFVLPANTPISVQPLDAEGKAMALFRSWFVGMPGETVSCIGCHEDQNEAVPSKQSIASLTRPARPEPWYGPKRGFSFVREVQPVLDRYCVGCHSGTRAENEKIPDLSFDPNDKNTYVRTGKSNYFSTSYSALHPYVRRNGLEGDYHPLTPLEFHADTSELIQILKKNHHGVRLDREAWDRLVTWIDLNVPFYGTWHEASRGRLPASDQRVQRRYELRKRYAGIDEDIEAVTETYVPVPFVKPDEPARPTETMSVEGWPFDTDAAKARQGANAMMALPLTDQIHINFVRVPAGRFVMGSRDGELDELPLCAVAIPKPFWMATTEVSNQQYRVFDERHDSGYLDAWWLNQPRRGYDVRQPDSPVIRVSWQRAMEFCEWVSKRTGRRMTLPTEAQWEWACRAGSAADMSYGERVADFSHHENLADVTTKQLVRGGIANTPLENPSPAEAYLPADYTSDDGALVTTRIGSYRPNAWGLHDMHGNVQEWTRSTYLPYPFREMESQHALDATERKVVRGGSWRDRPKRATASYRRDYPSWQAVYNVGFRVIIEE